MALQLKETNNIIYAFGRINACTSDHLLACLKRNSKNSMDVRLNIDKIDAIDGTGLLALYKFYREAQIFNINFRIEGRQANALLERFSLSQAS